MRKTSVSLLAVLIVSASVFTLRAAVLAGVTLPASQRVGGANLVLNGLGLRTKYFIKVYVAGLYVERKSTDPASIVKNDAPKRIVMQFLHGVSKAQMTDAFNESFSDNSPDALKTMKGEIDRFLGALEPMKVGDQMVFTYAPGAGTTFAVNGREKVTIAGADFSQVLFSVWLGPKPPSAELKKGLLGQ